MFLPNVPISSSISPEERAFFARLAALNVALESTRAGKTAQRFCHNAQSSETLLAAFLNEIRTAPLKA
jgi:hypothetical protein